MAAYGASSTATEARHQSELEQLHRHIAKLEQRCLLLESMVVDSANRLESQEDERIRVEYMAKKQKEQGEKDLIQCEEKVTQMATRARAQEVLLLAEKEKNRRVHRDLHLFHKRKHDMAERIRQEHHDAKKDKERAVSDIQFSSARGGDHHLARGSAWETRGRGVVGLTSASTGNIFARVFASCGPGGGGRARGGQR